MICGCNRNRNFCGRFIDNGCASREDIIRLRKTLDKQNNDTDSAITNLSLKKQDKLTAGKNITIDIDNTISATTGTIYTAGDGIKIENDVISVEPESKLKFHSVAGSSATYIVEFPNGKNMIIDTGQAYQWDAIKTAVDSLGIKKFDYAVVTHFHADHDGNIENVIDTYDARDWYVQMKPDYANHAAVIYNSESEYDDQIAIFTSKGITPIVPENNSTIVVDDETSIRFLNTSPTIAEGYYTRYSDSGNGVGIDYNVFSVLVEITHKNIKMLATGDMECPTEDAYASYIGKINVMTAAHHGINRDANRAFYYGAMPDFAICSNPNATSTWAQPTYNPLLYFKEIGTKVIASYSSIPVNGLYSFISDGDNVYTTALDSAYTDVVYNYGEVYTHFGSVLKNTTYDAKTITLAQLLNNMPRGSILRQRWDSSYDTAHPQLSNDLRTVFPLFNYQMTVELRPLYNVFEVSVYDNSLKFTARSPRQAISWSKCGEGAYDAASIENQADLIQFIQNVPKGHYSIHYYRDTNGNSGVLDPGSGYLLSIEKTGSNTAMITGVLKANATGTDKARAVFGYASGLTTTPAVVWHKVNN